MRYPLQPLGGNQSTWSRDRPTPYDKMIEEMDNAGIAKSVDSSLSADEATRRKVLEFAKVLVGTPIVVVPADAAASAADLDKLATEYEISVAIDSRTDPKALMTALTGRSKHVGVAANLGAWMQSGVTPVDGLKTVGDRLLVVNATDRSGAKGGVVPLGAGSGALSAFFLSAWQSKIKPLAVIIESPGTTDADMKKNLDAFERVMLPAMAERVREMLASPAGQIRGGDRLSADVRAKIDAAVPTKAVVTPKKPRKMLVTDIQMYSGHSSIPHGNYLLQQMAKATGAFEATFSNEQMRNSAGTPSSDSSIPTSMSVRVSQAISGWRTS